MNIVAMALVLIFCRGGNAQQATVVKIGDTGSISFPVAAGPLGLALEGVTVSVSAGPSLDLQILPSSQLGPATILPGTTHVFLIDYQIGPEALDGASSATLHYSVPDPDAFPDRDDPAQDAQVSFPIGTLHRLVGRRERAIRQDGLRASLNFGGSDLFGLQWIEAPGKSVTIAVRFEGKNPAPRGQSDPNNRPTTAQRVLQLTPPRQEEPAAGARSAGTL